MNVLENYIVEVHEVRPYTADWTKEFPNKTFVFVELTSNCHGNKKRGGHIFNNEEWKLNQERGYFLA